MVNSIKNEMLKNYDDCQYGFRTGSSTQCAVIALTDHLTEYLDRPSTCGAVIVSYDYSKAFDRLRTDLIVQRLIDCEFPPQCVKWILDYLTARTQYVKVGITRSSATNVTSGVPQGSVIGPYLYALTTATFRTSHSDCRVVKYADDTTICFPVYPSSSPHIRNEHLNLLRWSSSMDLKMNARKCKAVVIAKKDKDCCVTRELPEVPVVDSMDILGVRFNSKATWSNHIDKIITIASRRMFAMRILKPCLSRNQLRDVYFSYIRSVVEYCAPLLTSLSVIDNCRLERLQRRFYRLLCGKDCANNCFASLEERRWKLSIKFLQSVMQANHVLNSLLPPISSTGRFLLPSRRTFGRGRSFFFLVPERYNFLSRRKDVL